MFSNNILYLSILALLNCSVFVYLFLQIIFIKGTSQVLLYVSYMRLIQLCLIYASNIHGNHSLHYRDVPTCIILYI